MICCIGPFCVPLYALLPFILAFLGSLQSRIVSWFREIFSPKSSQCCANMSGKDGSLIMKENAVEGNSNLPPAKHAEEWSVVTKQVIDIESMDQWQSLIDESKKSKGKKPLVVKFSATWCGPCKRIAPLFQQICSEFNGSGNSVCFVEVDTDELEDLVDEYDISAMPTFKVIKLGTVVDTVLGADEAKLRAMIENTC